MLPDRPLPWTFDWAFMIGSGGFFNLVLENSGQMANLILFGGGAIVVVTTKWLDAFAKSDRAKRLQAEAERDELRDKLEQAIKRIDAKDETIKGNIEASVKMVENARKLAEDVLALRGFTRVTEISKEDGRSDRPVDG